MVSSTCACFAYVLMVFYSGQLVGTLDASSAATCDKLKSVISKNYAPEDRRNLKLECEKK